MLRLIRAAADHLQRRRGEQPFERRDAEAEHVDEPVPRHQRDDDDESVANRAEVAERSRRETSARRASFG
jgi:hypothetical protein